MLEWDTLQGRRLSFHSVCAHLLRLTNSSQDRMQQTVSMATKVRPREIEYLEIRVHNPYHEDLIELNPRMSAFFKLEDV